MSLKYYLIKKKRSKDLGFIHGMGYFFLSFFLEGGVVKVSMPYLNQSF